MPGAYRTCYLFAPAVLLSDFDFELPEAQIAQQPAERRDASRLLDLPAQGPLVHRHFPELAERLPAGALLVVNDAKVIPARLFAHRPSGGRHEILLSGPSAAPGVWTALVRGQVRPGDRLTIAPPRGRAAPAGAAPILTVIGRDDDGTVRLRLPEGAEQALIGWGELPLPPYIARPEGIAAEDDARYQTVYARVPGAIAAPTAGLHFTEALLARLAARGIERHAITLHVGLGTFSPVRTDDLAAHVMHEERFDIPAATAHAIAAARREGRPIVAVGTTVVRALESTTTAGPGATRLFITPGFDFKVVDHLITNFHLPRSTLLVLVAAFAGRERILAAYREAVSAGYRFFSYGDAMLLEKVRS
jgi:S-adenosylmethionine:tRNA ribosyltransferase-isomerase